MINEMKSETIGELAAALCKAQGMMEAAKKDSKNPFFKSNYADLNSVIQASKEPLRLNNLAYTQVVQEKDGVLYLITLLMHTSGEWIASGMRLILNKQDMQAYGSALSYARRYTLQAIIGLSAEDDDGNKAVGVLDSSQPNQKTKPQLKPIPFQITEGHFNDLKTQCNRIGWSRERLDKLILDQTKKPHLNLLNEAEYQMIYQFLKKEPDPSAEFK